MIKTLNARSHELTTHYDMQHMQDAMLKDIELAVQSRQDDIQFLQIEMKELQGKIASLKRLQNDKQNLEEELVASQVKLCIHFLQPPCTLFRLGCLCLLSTAHVANIHQVCCR